MKPILKVLRLDKKAKLPTKATEGSACWDIYALEDFELDSNSITKVRTGLAIECPKGYFLDIRPRSGLASKDITIINSPGTLDEDYRGELLIGLIWHLAITSLDPIPYTIRKYDRIAQIRLVPIIDFKLEEVNKLSETERGIRGFGSTGK